MTTELQKEVPFSISSVQNAMDPVTACNNCVLYFIGWRITGGPGEKSAYSGEQNQRTTLLTYSPSRELNQDHSDERQALYTLKAHAIQKVLDLSGVVGFFVTNNLMDVNLVPVVA